MTKKNSEFQTFPVIRIDALTRPITTEQLDDLQFRRKLHNCPVPSTNPAPGHTDLMVTPESIDAFLDSHPLPPEDQAGEAGIYKSLYENLQASLAQRPERLSDIIEQSIADFYPAWERKPDFARFIAERLCASNPVTSTQAPGAAQCQGEPVAWRIYCTQNGVTGYLYTEQLPFNPGIGVHVRREPEPLYAANRVPSTDRNWLEDAAHENGNYECSCVECGHSFIGHKRRVLCKLCSNLLKPMASTDSASPAQPMDSPKGPPRPFGPTKHTPIA